MRVDYYPFGLQIGENGYQRESAVDQNYKYNGKELQTDLDLNWHDYGARMYDASIGRWYVVDGKTEEYHDVTPFLYSLNNPLRFIDPDGFRVWDMTTDKDHKSALARFAKTPQGRRFLAQYAKAGDVIGGVTFDKDGKYSHQNVAFYSSSSLPKKYRGNTRQYLRTKKTPQGLPLRDITARTVKENFDGLDNLAFAIDLRKGLSEDQALETIGHESFIHVEKTTKDIKNGITDLQDGKFGDDSGIFGEFAMFVQGLSGDDSDHKLAVDGKVATMEEFVDALDEVSGGTKFRDMYDAWKDYQKEKEDK